MNESVKFSVLASGSTGNTTFIESHDHKILIDAGLSGKKIKELMAVIGQDLNDVDSLFVTHEHSDHIQGVGVLARKYHMDVYANPGTWAAMTSKIGNIAPEQKKSMNPGDVLDLGDMDIESFAVSHDAAQPQFYQVHGNNKTLCILTDTGYVSENLSAKIRNADAYLLECNHDMEMLRMGTYSWTLKQRILGDKGHLSNEDGAQALISTIGQRTKQIYLGHRSKENNMRSLAHLTVASILQEHDLGVAHDFQIYDTEPEHPTKLVSL